jgi:hypothetical protein
MVLDYFRKGYLFLKANRRVQKCPNIGFAHILSPQNIAS